MECSPCSVPTAYPFHITFLLPTQITKSVCRSHGVDAVGMQQQIESLVRSKMEELTAKRIRQVGDRDQGMHAHNCVPTCTYTHTYVPA